MIKTKITVYDLNQDLYQQPNGSVKDFQLFLDQLDHIKSQHKGKELPPVHVLGDFREIVRPESIANQVPCWVSLKDKCY